MNVPFGIVAVSFVVRRARCGSGARRARIGGTASGPVIRNAESGADLFQPLHQMLVVDVDGGAVVMMRSGRSRRHRGESATHADERRPRGRSLMTSREHVNGLRLLLRVDNRLTRSGPEREARERGVNRNRGPNMRTVRLMLDNLGHSLLR